MIYFIRQNEAVKIGVTEDIQQRVSQIQVGTPYEVSVMLLIEGSYEKEAELHKTFNDFKIRGEWYWLSEEIKEYVAMMYENDLRYEHGLLDPEGIDPSIQTSFIRNMNKLTLREVGEKLGMTAQSVKETESRELHGTVSLNSLRKYGEALGYELQYRFIKNDSE